MRKAKVFSVIAVTSVFMLLALGSSSTSNSKTNTTSEKSTTPLATVASEKKEAEEQKNKVIGIGDEFGNKTITGVVTDVNLDFTDYNDMWTKVPEDKKCIYITIKMTNISDSSNYVSVGDFRCYADDVSVDAELVSGGDDAYNENIDPGRSAILGAMYVIPKDATSIELEYHPLGESAERVIIKIL